MTDQVMPFIGIDYGTCNSSMAWFNPMTSQAEVLKNAEGEERTRSLVYFGPDELVVGSLAEHLLADEEARAFVYPPGAKREIAKKMEMLLGDRRVTPTDVAVAVLHKLKRDAEELHFHTQINRAVLTVPATFDQLEKEHLEAAARKAGFGEVVLLAEPVAAALAFLQSGLNIGKIILVYDLGAGTFDLALLAREPDRDEFSLVQAPRGLRKGGDDFDRALYSQVDQKAKEEGRSLNKNASMNLEILRQCRERKENLSIRHEAIFSSFLPDGRPFRYKLERKNFEGLIAGTIAETVELTEKMLQEAHGQGQDVDTVVLIGGSSRIPIVERMLQEKLAIRPLKWQHQDVAVALGAAYYGETLWGTKKPLASSGTMQGMRGAASVNPWESTSAASHGAETPTADLAGMLKIVSISPPVPGLTDSIPPTPDYTDSDGKQNAHIGEKIDRIFPAKLEITPFQFRSGGLAYCLDDLIGLCEKHLEDAQYHFNRNEFEIWFRNTGNSKLADVCRAAFGFFFDDFVRVMYFLENAGEEGRQAAKRIKLNLAEKEKLGGKSKHSQPTPQPRPIIPQGNSYTSKGEKPSMTPEEVGGLVLLGSLILVIAVLCWGLFSWGGGMAVFSGFLALGAGGACAIFAYRLNNAKDRIETDEFVGKSVACGLVCFICIIWTFNNKTKAPTDTTNPSPPGQQIPKFKL